YYQWCKENSFTSKLPKDREEEKKSGQHSTSVQGTLDSSLIVTERKTPYSQSAMNEAIWTFIIDTNQSLSIVERPSFQKMIRTASTATGEVLLPDRKLTRKGIMKMFHKRMAQLKKLFMVCRNHIYTARCLIYYPRMRRKFT
ncbi:hypothetical protein F5890DRAFT_1422173, partial [Lentinula detonsa]